MNLILSNTTGQPLERVETDTDRDFFMSGVQAVEYGIVDRVITTRTAQENEE